MPQRRSHPSTSGGPVNRRKVATVMREFKKGSLRSSSGDRVTTPTQGIAIALSEARRA